MDDEFVQQLRDRLAAEPHDLELRYRYGEALFRSGDIRSALPELQQARLLPAYRPSAMRMITSIVKQLGIDGSGGPSTGPRL